MLNIVHLSRVDLNLLVLFDVVLAEGHVGRAASRLGLTASAVSHGLGRLRHMLNDPLFLRTPRGVVPSERALALQGPIEEILSAVSGVLASAEAFDPATSRRRFVIGAPDAVLASMAVPLLQCVRATAPLIDLGLVHLMPLRTERGAGQPWTDCLAQLERREIDVALLPVLAPAPRFHAQRLYDEDFVVAMRRGHPFARKSGQAEFVAADHLLVSLSGDAHGFVDDTLRAQGQQRRIVLTVPSFMMALELLAGTDLLATLPRRLVHQHASRLGLVSTELPFDRAADPIQAIATKAAMRDAGTAWIFGMLASLFARTGRRRPAALLSIMQAPPQRSGRTP